MRYYGRVGYVRITDYDTGAVYTYGNDSPLDFKFDGKKIGKQYCNFNVSILGLTNDAINNIVTWNPGEFLTTRSKFIEVFAGYEEDGASLLFSGYIKKSHPTPPPERWVSFECLHFNGDKDPTTEMVQTFTTEGTFKQIFEEVASIMGLGSGWEYSDEYDKDITSIFNGYNDYVKGVQESYLADKLTESAVEISQSDRAKDYFYSNRPLVFSTSGNMKTLDLGKEFGRHFNVHVYVEDGLLKVAPWKPWAEDAPEKQAPSEIEVDTAHGLISVGEVSMFGITVRVRLNDTMKLYDTIRFTSSTIPKANGTYRVISKHHVGHMRGGEWYTDLTCARKGATA